MTTEEKNLRLVFYIHSLVNFGGAERVFLLLLQNLDRKKFDITLLMCKKEGRYLNEIPRDVEVVSLEEDKTVYAIPKILKFIWKRKPDLFFTIRNILLAAVSKIARVLSPQTKFIVREVIIPSMHNQSEPFPKLFDLGYRILYPWYDRIICQSDDMLEDLKTTYCIKPGKLAKIHNPVDARRISRKLAVDQVEIADGRRIRLLAMGRLMHQKGFDLLIEAFSRLPEEFCLEILGQGEQREMLQKMIDEKNLAGRISLAGFREDPYSRIAAADIFVLSSRYEGLSNAILEVMLCGTPVVAFNCPGGIQEIVLHGINGLVVPPCDVDSLAEGILKASKTIFSKGKIKNSILGKFALRERVLEYERLFIDVSDSTGCHR